MTAFLYVSPGPLDHLDQKAMGMADWNDQDDLSSPSPTLLASGQSKKVTFPRTWTMVQEERFDWTHVKGRLTCWIPGDASCSVPGTDKAAKLGPAKLKVSLEGRTRRILFFHFPVEGKES